MIEVPEHAVGAADVDLVLTPVREIVDAAMLKEPSNDAAHRDGRRQAGDSGPQGADSPDYQVNREAGLGGFVQRANQLGVGHVINLEYQSGVAARFLVFNLAVNHLDESISERDRGDQEFAVSQLPRATGQVIEQVVGVGTHHVV